MGKEEPEDVIATVNDDTNIAPTPVEKKEEKPEQKFEPRKAYTLSFLSCFCFAFSNYFNSQIAVKYGVLSV